MESHERAEIQAPGSGRFKDRHEGVYYKKKVMQWFLKKGDPYNRDSTFTMDFEHTWGSKRLPSRNHRWVANLLYANADDKAPATFRGGPMRLVCRLQVDFNEVPHEHFQLREREDGKPYRLLQYQLVMRFGKNELEFALRVDGEEYGKMITGTFDQEI